MPDPAPRRPLGRVRFDVSRLGVSDSADRRRGTAACVEALERAVELGCNVLETSPSGAGGLSEVVVGHVARNHPRASLFLILKIERLRSSVIPQLDSSIFKLRVEPIDLAIFESVADLAALERLLAPGGGFDECEVARREGLIRYRGLSTSNPTVIERCLEDGRLDALLFTARAEQLGELPVATIARCRERGVGTLLRQQPAGDDPEEWLRKARALDPDVVLLAMPTPERAARALAAFHDAFRG